MKGLVRLAFVILAIGLASVAAACGGGDDEDGGAAETAATTSVQDTAAGETGAASEPATTEAPAQGGSISVAAAQGIPQLDPYKILFAWEEVLYNLVWNSLTDYIPGSAEIQPELAESWEASDDLKVYTFKLRQGVTFSNGKELTADDVIADLERALDPETTFIWSFLIPKIASMTAVDPYTLEITLEQPSAVFAESLSKIPIMDPESLDQINEAPVGTGPFVVTEFVPEDHVTLARNDSYWGDPPALDEISIIKAQDPTAAVTGLRTGDIDVLWSIPWQDAAELDGSGDVNIITSENPSASIIIETDNTSPPFDNPKARQALVHATNKQAIIDAAYAGKALVSDTNQPIPSNHPLFDASVPAYGFDLERAKQLFAEAGINEGDTLTFWAPAGQYPEWTTFGQILQSDLATIGINLEIKTEEINTWAEKFAPAGKTWPEMLVPNFYSGFAIPLVLGFWTPGICECNFDNAEYNALLDQVNSTSDEAQQQALWGQAQALFSTEAPVVIIGQTSWPIGVRSEVTGVWEDPGTIIHVESAALSG